METGKIALVNVAGKPASVEVELVNNNLWLCKREIAKIFNCYPQKIEMNLRSIFKNRLLLESEVTYLRRYIYKETECQRMYYNMDVLIFLSYRIGTREAKIIRDFINDSFREHVKKKNKQQRSKIVWLMPPNFN